MRNVHARVQRRGAGIPAVCAVVAWHVRGTNTDLHTPASIAFEAGAIIFGLLFALLAGFLASFIGGRPHFVAAWIVGALIALTALAVMFREGLAWPQMSALLFMAPAAVVGGWSYVLRQRTKQNE